MASRLGGKQNDDLWRRNRVYVDRMVLCFVVNLFTYSTVLPCLVCPLHFSLFLLFAMSVIREYKVNLLSHLMHVALELELLNGQP